MKKNKQNNRKKGRKAKQQLSAIATIKLWWKDKNPVVLFVAAFAFLMAVFYTIINLDFFTNGLQAQLTNLYADISSVLLNILGQNTTANNTIIASSTFSINVKYGCDAVEPIALLMAAILAYPVAFRKKPIGILVGGILLFILNIVRIVSLFLVGVYWHSMFEIMHIEIWQFLFILAAIILCFFWIQWAIQSPIPPSTQKTNTNVSI